MRATKRKRQWGSLARRVRARLVIAAGLSAALAIAVLCAPHGNRRSEADLMRTASVAMEETLVAVSGERIRRELPTNAINDPNSTGLIGAEFSKMTSTLGQLGAKRTTTNPNFAGLLTLLLLNAGVKEDGSVAICASGSFPALLLATLHAVETLGATPLLIISLSASMYGANEEAFTLLDILDGYCGTGLELLAASVGGGDDRGSGLDVRTVGQLESKIHDRMVRLISPFSLPEAVLDRMLLFDEATPGRGVDCFVSIGGSWACMGTHSDILKIPPGLTTAIGNIPNQLSRGMIFEFLAQGVPIIHLLNIHDLAARYGLPWDPVPLPRAGDGALYYNANEESLTSVWPAIAWVCSMGLLIAVPSRQKLTHTLPRLRESSDD
jgi:poly-gamma-glutamate system protein